MSFYYNVLKVGAKILPTSVRRLIKKFYSFPVVGMGESLIGKTRMDAIMLKLQDCVKLEGDIIECGVYRGGGCIAMSKKLRELGSDKIIYGLDTFEGFPYADEEDKTKGVQNAYEGHLGDTSFKDVQKEFDKKGIKNVKLIKGLFSDTFPSLKDKKFCFAYIDADIYLSTKQCIDFLKPRMVEGGIMMFDDYNSNVWEGATKAIDECLGKENLVLIEKKGCYWIKN